MGVVCPVCGRESIVMAFMPEGDVRCCYCDLFFDIMLVLRAKPSTMALCGEVEDARCIDYASRTANIQLKVGEKGYYGSLDSIIGRKAILTVEGDK